MKRKKVNYKAYIKSDKWKKKSKTIIARRKRCYLCSCSRQPKNPLQCHHKTYKRLGNELSSDLVVLCKKCHMDLHTMLRHFKQPNFSLYNAHKVLKEQVKTRTLAWLRTKAASKRSKRR